MRGKKQLAAFVLSIGMLCGVPSAFASEDRFGGDGYIHYIDGSYGEVIGTQAEVADSTGTVIGTKTYVYHELDGTIAFSYTVCAAFDYDEAGVKRTGMYSEFYTADGWKRQRESIGKDGRTAVFSNGKKTKKLLLTVKCDREGNIS